MLKISNSMVLSVDDIKQKIKENVEQEILEFKYIHVGNEYRFTPDFGIHFNLLNQQERTDLNNSRLGLSSMKFLISAGVVKIYPGQGLIVQGYSLTVNAGPSAEDEQNISALLGIPAIEKWR